MDCVALSTHGFRNFHVYLGFQVFHMVTYSPNWDFYSLTNDGIRIIQINFGLQVFHNFPYMYIKDSKVG